MTLSSHQQRLATALILLPGIIWVVFQNDTIMAMALWGTATLGLYEYCSMFWKSWKKTVLFLLAVALGTIISLCFGPTTLDRAPLALSLLFILPALVFLKNYSASPSEASFFDLTLIMAGVIYLPFLLQLFRFITPVETLLVLGAAFATDTGGFYAGGRWGGKKIWPQISPKKTWAGSLGGMALTTIFCFVMGAIWGTSSCWSFIFLGIFLNIAAQLGDFFESALKRWAGVKDSGHLLPGHGGIMDRIDSILFALPAYYLAHTLSVFF